MGTLRQDLAGEGVEVVETHISLVFLRRSDVLKVKKAVALGFLDYSTIERRRAACEAEVTLNRRLAPASVYRGVVPIFRGADGLHQVGIDDDGSPAPDPPGEVVDWAVWMTRLDDARRADHLLAEGRFDEPELVRVATRLAAFHAAARADETTASFGSRATIEANVRENFEQTRATVGRHLDPEAAAAVESWQLATLAEKAELFAARAAAGRVRDGHGDLRLEHVYLDPAPPAADDGVAILDCIEFNDRFRYGDVCADVAFLAMDLTRLGRADLAERFLALYAREADDYGLFPLVDFYESYRAWVRGKVASFVADDPATHDPGRFHDEARRYFLLALASARRPLLPPSVVAVGGVIGAGKTTVGGWISRVTGGPAIDADRTRKHLLGVEPTAPVHDRPFAGSYTEEVTDRVYAELLARAGDVLASGRPVVLDASFRARRHREAARRLARERGVDFVFVECRAAPALCRERLAKRARERGVSDGRLEIFDDFLAAWEPVDELAAEEHLVLDTARERDDLLAEFRRRVPTWPAPPNG